MCDCKREALASWCGPYACNRPMRNADHQASHFHKRSSQAHAFLPPTMPPILKAGSHAGTRRNSTCDDVMHRRSACVSKRDSAWRPGTLRRVPGRLPGSPPPAGPRLSERRLRLPGATPRRTSCHGLQAPARIMLARPAAEIRPIRGTFRRHSSPDNFTPYAQVPGTPLTLLLCPHISPPHPPSAPEALLGSTMGISKVVFKVSHSNDL